MRDEVVRPFLMATTPHYDEPPDMLDRCGDSIPAVFGWYPYEAPLRRLVGGGHMVASGRHFATESELRNFGRQHAQQVGASWWLQLDADETLVNGDQLHDVLEHWPTPGYGAPRCYPLPRVEESGAVSLCPYKLVRLPCRLVAGCDHFQFGGDLTTWRLSVDRSATEQERAALLQGPHLLHEPSRRPSSPRPRLGTTENVLEPRPANAVEWPLPSHLGRSAA